jgi:hypothetical protein
MRFITENKTPYSAGECPSERTGHPEDPIRGGRPGARHAGARTAPVVTATVTVTPAVTVSNLNPIPDPEDVPAQSSRRDSTTPPLPSTWVVIRPGPGPAGPAGGNGSGGRQPPAAARGGGGEGAEHLDAVVDEGPLVRRVPAAPCVCVRARGRGIQRAARAREFV